MWITHCENQRPSALRNINYSPPVIVTNHLEQHRLVTIIVVTLPSVYHLIISVSSHHQRTVTRVRSEFLQLRVDETNSSCETDVRVVEVAETSERTDGQNHDEVLEEEKSSAMDVVLDDPREAPMSVQDHSWAQSRVENHVGIYDGGRNNGNHSQRHITFIRPMMNLIFSLAQFLWPIDPGLQSRSQWQRLARNQRWGDDTGSRKQWRTEPMT